MSIYLSVKLNRTDVFVTGGWKPNKYQDFECDVALFHGLDILRWLRRKNKEFTGEVLTNAFLRNASRRKLYPERIEARDFYNEDYGWIHRSPDESEHNASIVGYYEYEDTIYLVAEVDKWCLKAYQDTPQFDEDEEIDVDEFDISYLTRQHDVFLCLYEGTIQVADKGE